jgi:hypothetical protein
VQGIFQQRAPRLYHYYTPQWWTAPFGYLSFLPLQPTFNGYPVDRLKYIPPLEKDENGFCLNKRVADSWFRLEQKLVFAMTKLVQKYPVGVVCPFHPSSWGYRQYHSKHYVARERAILSRDWFVIFMTGLSFLLAAGGVNPLPAPIKIPEWFSLLVGEGFDQNWLAGVATSSICDFSLPRVGLFLDLMDPGENQPMVDWFVYFSIPVWYPWRAREDYAMRTQPNLSRWAPPSHLLQELAGSVMTREPSVFQSRSETPTRAETPVQPPPAEVHPTWQEFFAQRERLKAQKLEKETPKAREARLNRAKKPPTVSAPVFTWVASDNDPSRLVRQPVIKSMREETLGDYSEKQRKYDAFWNEWDCCEEFGPGEGDEYDEDYGGLAIDINQNHPSDPPTTIRSYVRSPSPRPIIDELVLPQAGDTNDMSQATAIDVLYAHYGFVPPLPIPSLAGNALSSKDRETLLQLVGLTDNNDPIFSTGLGKIALEFVQTLASGQYPKPALWDLSRENRQSLVFNNRLRQCRRLPSGLFLFDFGKSATVPWKIGVPRAADALYICRLDPKYNDLDIATHLLMQGIEFRTLLPLRDIPSLPKPPKPMLPIRMGPGYIYKFSKRDFDTYQHQLAATLGTPRGRAALLWGRILWRIAVQGISFASVLRGPSPSVLVHRDGFRVEDPETGDCLWDDELSEDDNKLLCGTYVCYTGMYLVPSCCPNGILKCDHLPGNGTQTAQLSWFALPAIYDHCRDSYGFWTDRNEAIFQRRLDKIEDGVEGWDQPIPQHKWRDYSRGCPNILRKLKLATYTCSEFFIVHRTGL